MAKLEIYIFLKSRNFSIFRAKSEFLPEFSFDVNSSVFYRGCEVHIVNLTGLIMKYVCHHHNEDVVDRLPLIVIRKNSSCSMKRMSFLLQSLNNWQRHLSCLVYASQEPSNFVKSLHSVKYKWVIEKILV